jgi:hypothetical protein
MSDSRSLSERGDDAGVAQRPSTRFGLLRRQERWGLSWRGWLVLGLVLAALTGWFAKSLHPFLAAHAPVDAEVAVIQGWMPRYALKLALPELEARGCRRFITAGGWLNYTSQLDPDDTYAELAAERLRVLGVSWERIVPVPCVGQSGDDVCASGRAVREWLEQQGMKWRAVNVVTVGTHARKTRLAYQAILGRDVVVGVVAIPNQAYEAQTWWRSSEGVKAVLEELAAYLHIRIFGCGQ